MIISQQQEFIRPRSPHYLNETIRDHLNFHSKLISLYNQQHFRTHLYQISIYDNIRRNVQSIIDVVTLIAGP